jgi:hypothetical protein
MEDEEARLDNEVEKEKSLKYVKKVSVHFVSKGRGVSENKEDRARVKVTSDSTNVFPFSRSGEGACRQLANAKCNADADGRCVA